VWFLWSMPCVWMEEGVVTGPPVALLPWHKTSAVVQNMV